MPVEYVAGTEGDNFDGVLAITIPASVQAGHVMLLNYHVALDTAPVNLPAGWSYVPDSAPGPKVIGSSRAAMIYKVATGGDASSVVDLAVTQNAPVKQTAVLSAWSGVDQANPIHKVSFLGNAAPTGTSHPSASVVTTIDNAGIITTYSSKDSVVNTITPPTGYTDRNWITMPGGGRSSAAQASKLATTGGSYGGEAWGTDATPGSTYSWTVALTPEVSTQTIRPVSDVTATNVTDQSDGTTDLFSTIDEISLNQADYIKGVQGGVYEGLLATAATPPAGSGAQVSYVLGLGDGATGATYDVYLMEGATEIAHWTDVIDTDNTPVSHTLTGLQFDAITDWANLRLRFVFTEVTG